jgi:hypothetical protein
MIIAAQLALWTLLYLEKGYGDDFAMLTLAGTFIVGVVLMGNSFKQIPWKVPFGKYLMPALLLIATFGWCVSAPYGRSGTTVMYSLHDPADTEEISGWVVYNPLTHVVSEVPSECSVYLGGCSFQFAFVGTPKDFAEEFGNFKKLQDRLEAIVKPFDFDYWSSLSDMERLRYMCELDGRIRTLSLPPGVAYRGQSA